MNILVTGGAGYIGSHAVLALRDAGHTVVVLDNLVYGHKEVVEALDGVRLVVGDIGDRSLVDSIFAQEKIDAVMHFSAYAYVGESVDHPSKYYQNNVVATLSLLDAMIAAGVKQFVFSSTCATYGVPETVPITEEMPQKPINPYGATKLMVERILADYEKAYGLRSVVFRYFNAAGADPQGRSGENHDPETHLIPLVIRAALESSDSNGFKLQIFGTDYDTPDGTCVRDYIHVSDLADAHLLGLNYLDAGGASDCFNLGNGGGYSVREVITAVEDVSSLPVPFTAVPRRAGDPPELIGSAAKARVVLQWNPKFYVLSDIIKHAWDWATA